MKNEYLEANHPTLKTLNMEDCYLCGKPLGDESTPDHIIPDSIFRPGSPNRPQLPVHHKCNNSKSKDDKFFGLMLAMFSQFNPDAEKVMKEFIEKAKQEAGNAFLVGRSSKLPNYKLARMLFDDIVWGLDVRHENQTKSTMHIDKANSARFDSYIKKMCQGLFTRNIPGAKPYLPYIFRVQYEKAVLTGDGKVIYEAAQQLLKQSAPGGFAQQWGDRVAYFGSRVSESPDRGFVYIHFYRQIGFFAAFPAKDAPFLKKKANKSSSDEDQKLASHVAA